MCPVALLVRGRTGRAGQSQATPAGTGEALGLNAVSLPPHHHLSVFFPRKDQAMYRDLDDGEGAG